MHIFWVLFQPVACSCREWQCSPTTLPTLPINLREFFQISCASCRSAALMRHLLGWVYVPGFNPGSWHPPSHAGSTGRCLPRDVYGQISSKPCGIAWNCMDSHRSSAPTFIWPGRLVPKHAANSCPRPQATAPHTAGAASRQMTLAAPVSADFCAECHAWCAWPLA